MMPMQIAMTIGEGLKKCKNVIFYIITIFYLSKILVKDKLGRDADQMDEESGRKY
jgi:hypothetical protein